MYENKEQEGKKQSNPCFHLQLLSQEAYIYIKKNFKKRVSRSFVKLKCLKKPKEVEGVLPSKACVPLPLPTSTPGKSPNPLFFLWKSD